MVKSNGFIVVVLLLFIIVGVFFIFKPSAKIQSILGDDGVITSPTDSVVKVSPFFSWGLPKFSKSYTVSLVNGCIDSFFKDGVVVANGNCVDGFTFIDDSLIVRSGQGSRSSCGGSNVFSCVTGSLKVDNPLVIVSLKPMGNLFVDTQNKIVAVFDSKIDEPVRVNVWVGDSNFNYYKDLTFDAVLHKGVQDLELLLPVDLPKSADYKVSVVVSLRDNVRNDYVEQVSKTDNTICSGRVGSACVSVLKNIEYFRLSNLAVRSYQVIERPSWKFRNPDGVCGEFYVGCDVSSGTCLSSELCVLKKIVDGGVSCMNPELEAPIRIAPKDVIDQNSNIYYHKGDLVPFTCTTSGFFTEPLFKYVNNPSDCGSSEFFDDQSKRCIEKVVAPIIQCASGCASACPDYVKGNCDSGTGRCVYDGQCPVIKLPELIFTSSPDSELACVNGILLDDGRCGVIPELAKPIVCPSVCKTLWFLRDNVCSVDTCGSGCGGNNVYSFDNKEDCDKMVQKIVSPSLSPLVAVSDSLLPVYNLPVDKRSSLRNNIYVGGGLFLLLSLVIGLVVRRFRR